VLQLAGKLVAYCVEVQKLHCRPTNSTRSVRQNSI